LATTPPVLPSSRRRPTVPDPDGNLPVLALSEAQRLARARSWEYVDLDGTNPSAEVLALITPDEARTHSLVPVDVITQAGRSYARIACTNPDDFSISGIARSVVNEHSVRLVYSPQPVIDRTIDRLYSASDQAAAETNHRRTPTNVEDNTDLGRIESGQETPAQKRLRLILTEAQRLGASDIQFEPRANGIGVRYAIDGRYTDPKIYFEGSNESVVNVIRVAANLQLDRRAMPDSGVFTWSPEDRGGRRATDRENTTVDIRVETVPTGYGIAATLRIQSHDWLEIGQLGFSTENEKRFRSAIWSSEGMVVVTAPTGHGKTVTMQAAVTEREANDVKIVTIEDPIERRLDGQVTQLAIGESDEMSASSLLRSTLRQRPHIVLVGEMRDEETANLAVDASQTGHLVLSTLHTADAVGVFSRFARLGVHRFDIASTLVAVVGQRLVRLLCPACKELRTTDSDKVLALGFDPGRAPANLYAPRPGGCQECRGTGWRGQTGIHEVMLNSASMADAIAADATASTLTAIAHRTGMVPLREDGFAKAVAGLTTLEEINAQTRRFLVTDPLQRQPSPVEKETQHS
jgi:type IV pilus assembly protein PilB